MKARKIAMLAALPAAILVANQAMADITVYGKVNVTTQQEDTNGTDTKDQWALESNASRFGIKASTDLGDSGLKAIAKMEYEVNVDGTGYTKSGTDSNGDTYTYDSTFSQRNIYGGIQGGFGTVIAGNFDTPVKESQGKVDLFNDQIYADIKNVIVGENRMSNIIMYSTPKMDSGLAVNVAVMPGEENDINCVPGNAGTDADKDGTCEDGLADAMSASLVYDANNLYLALGVDQAVKNVDTVRLTGQYKMGDFTLGAIVQQAKISEDDTNKDGTQDKWLDQNGYILSATYTMDKTTFKAQYGSSSNEDDADNNDVDVESYSLGVDYKLDKQAKVFAYWSDWSSEEGTADAGKNTIALGMEYSF